jgi:hypothetical protein
MRFKVEMFNPKVRHIVIFHLHAVDAEMAARLAKVAIMRKRSSALMGKAMDYRVEYVNRVTP